MNEQEIAYIVARTQVREALKTLRRHTLTYMECARQVMLSYLAQTYPDMPVEIIATMRDDVHPNSFDYTINFQFTYPQDQGPPSSYDPITREVWSYLLSIEIHTCALMRHTAPGTSGDDHQAQGIPGEDHPVGVERFLAPAWQDGHTPDPGEEGHTAVTQDTTHTVLDADGVSWDTSRYEHGR